MSTLEDRDFIVTLITSIATICSAYCAYLVASANSRHIRKIMRSKYDFVFKPNQDSELTAEMYREEVDKYFKETFGKPTELKLFDGQIYFVVSLDEDIKDETIQNMLFLRTYENAKLFQCTYTTQKGEKVGSSTTYIERLFFIKYIALLSGKLQKDLRLYSVKACISNGYIYQWIYLRLSSRYVSNACCMLDFNYDGFLYALVFVQEKRDVLAKTN